MKLDAVTSQMSIRSAAISYSKAKPARKRMLYKVLNATAQRLRSLRTFTISTLADQSKRAAALATLARIQDDIRTIDRALNAAPPVTAMACAFTSARHASH